jgi:hypothetical protein
MIGNNMDGIKEVKKHLSSKFQMKDLGAAKFILGMEIMRDRASRNIGFHHMKYIETFMKQFNMKDCKLVKVPIPMGVWIIVE